MPAEVHRNPAVGTRPVRLRQPAALAPLAARKQGPQAAGLGDGPLNGIDRSGRRRFVLRGWPANAARAPAEGGNRRLDDKHGGMPTLRVRARRQGVGSAHDAASNRSPPLTTSPSRDACPHDPHVATVLASFHVTDARHRLGQVHSTHPDASIILRNSASVMFSTSSICHHLRVAARCLPTATRARGMEGGVTRLRRRRLRGRRRLADWG